MAEESRIPPTEEMAAGEKEPALHRAGSAFAFVIIATSAPLFALLLSILLGESSLFPLETSKVLDGDGRAVTDIILRIRLPRAIMALATGAVLAYCGSALQALLRNPLADPFILGVSGGAALGASLVHGLGFSIAGLLSAVFPAGGQTHSIRPSMLQDIFATSSVVPALLGAWLASVLISKISREGGRISPLKALLAGVVFNAMASAAITFIRCLAPPSRQGEMTRWLAGNIPLAGPGTTMALTLTAALCFIMIRRLSHGLNLLELGDGDAALLGVDVAATRKKLMFWISLAVAAAVAFTGMIGFVGLIVPHIARRFLGADQRRLLPASAALGAGFLALADLASRLLLPALGTVPPVGAITALCGAPFFLTLLQKGSWRS